MSLCANYVFYLVALNYVTIETIQVLIQIAPFLMMFGTFIFFKEKFNSIQKLGAICLVISLLMFSNQRFDQMLFDQQYYTGLLLILIAAILWAIYALAQKKLLQTMNAVQIMFYVYIISTILLLPFTKPLQVFQLSVTSQFFLCLCGINTLVAYGAFSKSMKHWDGSRVSALIATTPLATFLFVYLCDFFWPQIIEVENFNGLALMGAFGVVISSAVTALAVNKTQPN